MVDKVKCRNQECKLFDVAVPVTNLYINRVAPLDGPWPCPVCGEEMKVARVVPGNLKGTGSKSTPRRITTSRPPSKTVGKKPVRHKSVKHKVAYRGMGKAAPSWSKEPKSKASGRKQGPRKRG